jgi:AraC-like DNA-binding protein
MNSPSGPYTKNETILEDNLVFKEDTLFLRIIFRSGVDTSLFGIRDFPIKSGNEIRVVKEISYNGIDSVTTNIQISDQPSISMTCRNFIPFESSRILLLPFTENAPFSVTVKGMYFDTIPPSQIYMAPTECGEQIDSIGVTLFCNTSSTDINATWWRIYYGDSLETPLFEELTDESRALLRFNIPFTIDSGMYAWQAAFRYKNGSFSPFSDKRLFRFPKPRPLSAKIESAYLSKIGSDKPLTEIKREEWVDIRVRFADDISWNTFAYLVVSLSHSDYPFSNPGNKGGLFYPDMNYVVNASFYIYKDSSLVELYEKPLENSFSTSIIQDGASGLYVSSMPVQDMLDTLSRVVKLRVRLLNEAKSGFWTLRAYCVSNPIKSKKRKDEVYSPIFKSIFNLEPSIRYPKYYIWGLFFLLAGMILFLVKRFSNRLISKNIKKNDLTAYLDKNLHREDLSRELVMSELNLTRSAFYELLEATGLTSFPGLLTELRLIRAKHLLMNTEDTVSEIAYSLGFTDPSYFNRVFKKKYQLPPAIFREQKRSA